jgi:basic membrane protein A
VNKVKEGTWKAESHWPGLADGIVDLAPMSDMVPKEVQDKVMAKKEAIIGGEKVFMGPIKDQSGAEKVAAGTAMSDPDMLGMTWFVQGVIGTTE